MKPGRLTLKRFVTGFVLAAVAACAVSLAVRAAEDDTAQSFLNPFPEGEIYQIAVIGDMNHCPKAPSSEEPPVSDGLCPRSETLRLSKTETP